MSILLGIVGYNTDIIVTYATVGSNELTELLHQMLKKINIGQHGKFKGHLE